MSCMHHDEYGRGKPQLLIEQIIEHVTKLTKEILFNTFETFGLDIGRFRFKNGIFELDKINILDKI